MSNTKMDKFQEDQGAKKGLGNGCSAYSGFFLLKKTIDILIPFSIRMGKIAVGLLPCI